MRFHRTWLTAFVLIVIFADPAEAVKLRTPIVGALNGQVLACFVTNVGTKPAEVEVELVDFFGATLTPDFEDCNAVPLAPRATCQAILPHSTSAYCLIDAKGKITGSVTVAAPTTLEVVEVVPATKK